jgi:predicted nucleic acid-binding protein
MWVRVVDLTDNKLARALMLELDQGEAAAIALVLEQGQSQILTDERDGRAKAKALGLKPVGVLGVLLRAKIEGDLVSVKEAMQALRVDAGFFIDDHLFEAILTEAGEQ